MKTKMTKVFALAMVFLMITLCGCAEADGIKKEAVNDKGTAKAYLYLRTVDDEKEYCLSLLEPEDELDMEAEPNVYKSEYEFDFEWSGNMLAVIQNEKDKKINDFRVIGDIEIAFGSITTVK